MVGMIDRTIRRETDADIPGIHALITAAFAEVADSDGREAAIVDALRDDDALALSLVAVEGVETLGHVAVSPVRIEDGTGGWFGIGPVTVAPHRQGGGLARALLESTLARLTEGGAGGVVVFGEPDFYAHFGFERVPGLDYPGAPEGYFQALRITDSQFPSGLVHYHPAFG